jgi:hypothetical protein
MLAAVHGRNSTALQAGYLEVYFRGTESGKTSY